MTYSATAVALFAVALSASAADVPAFRTHSIESKALPATANRAYQLLVPDLAGLPEGAKLPLVIYLHGAGAKGGDAQKPAAEVFPKLLARAELQKRFPCYILLPQCRDGNDAEGRPNNWVKWVGQKGNPPAKWEASEKEPSDQLGGAMLALDEVLAGHCVDPRRIYLTGVSMGGSGVCNWAAREPERFAAVVFACGLSEVGKAKAIAGVPIWMFHGSDDDVAPIGRTRKMVEALKDAGGTVKFTEYTGAGHGIAEKVFTENDHAVLTWLFDQKRGAKK